MATQEIGVVTSSDAVYAQRYSSKLIAEGIVNNPVNRILTENGCINLENSLQTEGGGTVTMQNQLRLSSKGLRGDVDVYSNAIMSAKAARTLSISKNTLSLQWPLQGTQTQQYVAFDIGSKNEMLLGDWAKSLVTASMLNQLGGNTATSITQYSVYNEGSFSGSDLITITGNNSTSVPTYHYWGSDQTQAYTNDASVTSSNVLSLKDFQLASEIITAQQQNKPTFQLLTGKPYVAVAFIGYTGFNQIKNEAVTAGQGFQLSQIYNANLAGGKTMDLQEWIFDNFKFVVVPDSWLPRGVNSGTGAEVANTRRCIIVGRNALDMSLGKGFSTADGGMIPAAKVEFDTNYKKLNGQGFGAASLTWGCKKTQQTGMGDGNSTSYDTSAYVITHYSRS